MRFPGMTIWDLVAAPFYIGLLMLIAYYIVQWRYRGTPHARYFYWGLGLKIVGCIGFALVYQFYYGGGDTFRYFANSQTLTGLFFTDPGQYVDLMSQSEVAREVRFELQGVTDVFWKDSTYMVARVASLFALFSCNLYLPMSLWFAFFSFLGLWGLYRTCCALYPDLYRYAAIPIFFIPSCFFWGSSMMQDSLVVGFLGALVYVVYRMVLAQKGRLWHWLGLLLCLYVLTRVKEYVLIAFAPAAFLWIVFSLERKIPFRNVRMLIKPIVWVLMLVALPIGITMVGQISEEYSVEKVFEEAEITANYIHRISVEQGGSAYSLGDIEYTPTGLIRVVPQAIVVTLFRPWLWEVRNPVMLLAALEGLVFLMLTLYLVYTIGFFRLIRQTLADPFLLCCLVFSLFFAFAVGASTFNFGSLVRYKIPCLFFYGLWLALTYGKTRRPAAVAEKPVESP